MALRFGNGGAPPTMPKRDTVAHGEESARCVGEKTGHRCQLPRESLQTAEWHKSEPRGLPGGGCAF